MSITIRTCSLFASALILSGCATAPVLEQRLGQVLPDDASAIYNPGGDTVMLRKGGASIVLPKTTATSTASVFRNGGLTSAAFYMKTVSGKGKVIAFSSEDTDLGLVGTIASRDGGVTLPASGTAAFNGGYNGLLVRASNKAPLGIIEGTTCLTASFGAAPSISGVIKNRNSGPFNDVVIPSTSLSAGGVFSGAVTGGESPSGTSSNGQVSGMFADVGAGEIVGALKLDHNISGTDYYEVGGFTTVAGAGPCP